MPLKNAGEVFGHGKENPFEVGFAAFDNGKSILVLVCDDALDEREGSRLLDDYVVTCKKHLEYLVKVASEKYDRGDRETDGSVLVMRADVAAA